MGLTTEARGWRSSKIKLSSSWSLKIGGSVKKQFFSFETGALPAPQILSLLDNKVAAILYRSLYFLLSCSICLAVDRFAFIIPAYPFRDNRNFDTQV